MLTALPQSTTIGFLAVDSVLSLAPAKSSFAQEPTSLWSRMRFVCLIILLISASGCSLNSRYALDDPIYQQKYADGASKGDILGKLKQAFDARHTKYLDGFVGGGGGQVGDAFGSLEIGREVYVENYFSNRISVTGLSGTDRTAVGLDVGARLQTPTRVAPFVGVGAKAGILATDVLEIAAETALDAEFDDDTDIDGLAAVYPEVGVHFWADGNLRFTLFGRYLVTTEGRDFDDWLIGGQIALFAR